MVPQTFSQETDPNDVSRMRKRIIRMKKEYIILTTIIAALSVYLILRNPDRTHYQLPKLPKIAKTDISKIEISSQDTTISLNKKDSKWRLEPKGYLADTNRVENMLDIIEKLTVTTLVSESKNYSRYNLDVSNKIAVKAWAGDRLRRDFEVGKAATSYRHTFVKLAGDDRVYHGRGNFRDRFDETVDELRDKTVLSFDQAKIEEIHITKGEQEMAFVRTEAPVEVGGDEETDAEPPPYTEAQTVWQTPDGKEGDETLLGRLLAALSNLKCEKYIDDLKKEDLSNPICIIQLKGAEEYTVSIFAKVDEDAKDYPTISSGNEYPFLLPKWQADNLMKDPAEMLKKQPPSTELTFAPSSPASA
jgi:hypothetical protein